MSSIIDALKKSDKNRTNENKSGIDEINFSDTNKPKNRRGFWLLVLFLLVVAAGVFAWQQGWHHKILSVMDNNEQTTESAVPKPTVSKTKDSKQTPKVAQKDKEPATVKNQTAKNQLIPPQQKTIKEKAELARKKALSGVKDTQLNNNKKPTEELATLAKVDTKSEALKEVEAPAINQEQNNTENPTKKPITKQDKSSLEPALKQDYLLLHQIDFAIRKNIPKIKLNIHIYDPEPENRMVLINGERYNIGDQIEDVLTVTDIVQEGIVVSYENIQFLIPK